MAGFMRYWVLRICGTSSNNGCIQYVLSHDHRLAAGGRIHAALSVEDLRFGQLQGAYCHKATTLGVRAHVSPRLLG